MIDIDERGGRDGACGPRQGRGCRYIVKSAICSLVQQQISTRTEHQQIRTRIVVEVTSDHAGRTVETRAIEP